MKTALISGISGQDGAYLARFLLHRGYAVIGASRDVQRTSLDKLDHLGIRKHVRVISLALSDFRSVRDALSSIDPHEVYNLAGQSSVGLSFEQPLETMESISVAIMNLLEGIRVLKKPMRLYNACSSESFGDIGDAAADETTPFRPRSPYATAKAAAFWQVANYREAYGLYACSGILFNHESPLRPRRFVAQKIVYGACQIASGRQETLKLGNLAVQRDWGWAPEYVEVMWRMLQQEHPDDFVIATGETNRLEDFVAEAFRVVGLDWRRHVEIDPSLFRPTDLPVSRANPAKAGVKLAWVARHKMRDVVREMMSAAREVINVDKPA